MKDHIDRAGIRVLIAVVLMFLFTFAVWIPVGTLWLGPWIYEGVRPYTLEWRKAGVLNLWASISPWVLTFTYCGITMFRAIRLDAKERDQRDRDRDANYRKTTIEARRLV